MGRYSANIVEVGILSLIPSVPHIFNNIEDKSADHLINFARQNGLDGYITIRVYEGDYSEEKQTIGFYAVKPDNSYIDRS
jgi:hypothetical protein